MNPPKFMVRAGVWLGAAVLLVLACHAEDVTNRFGFLGPEIFPIDEDIALLHSADLDGDGLNDLIVVNNGRSQIDLLYNQTGKTNVVKPVETVGQHQINELPPDARFRIQTISSEKRISSLVVADLNGDGKPDIAYFGGDPKELVVLYNQGTNGWSAPKHWPVDDGQLTQNALAVGDLNGDGLNDLVLLGDTQIYTFMQKPDHTFGEPEKIPYSGTVKAVQVLDIDGDGQSDLLLVNWGEPDAFPFPPAEQRGKIGAGNLFPLRPDSFVLRGRFGEQQGADCHHRRELRPRTDIRIHAQAGREPVRCFQAGAVSGSTSHQERADAAGNALGRCQWRWLAGPAGVGAGERPDLDLPAKTGRHAGAAEGIFDADGRKRHRRGGLERGRQAEHIFVERRRAADRRHATGRQGRFALSHVDTAGRQAAGNGKVENLQPNGSKVTLAAILDQDGKRTLVTRTADGKGKTQKLSDNFKSNPSRMMFHDVNQDGLMDLVVLIPYEKIKVLLQVPSKDFDEEDIAPPGGSVEEPWMSSLDVDGDGKPELLLAQKNFVRAVVLKQEAPVQNSTNQGEWVFSVKEQINGADSDSRLVGAAAVPNGTNAVNSLFLLDAERKALTLCERDSAGAWQVVRNISLPYSDFDSLQPLALGGSGPNSVAFMGKDAVAWMALSGDVWDLTNMDSYETPIKDGHLNDVVTGDLNNDGRKDLVFMETAKNYLDLVIFDANHKLVPWRRAGRCLRNAVSAAVAATCRNPREAAGDGCDLCDGKKRSGHHRARPDPGLSAGIDRTCDQTGKGRGRLARISINPDYSTKGAIVLTS